MRLFILDKTPLQTLSEAAEGDHVAYFRPLQTLGTDGDETSAVMDLAARGISIEWLEDRLSNAESEQIDQFVDQFLRFWFFDPDNHDPTLDRELSVGEYLAPDILSQGLSYIVRYGEIFSRILGQWQGVTSLTIITDLRDGEFVERFPDFGLPHASLLASMAASRGMTLQHRTSSWSQPSFGHASRPNAWTNIIRAWLGRWRHEFRRGRAVLSKSQDAKRRIYMLFHNGLQPVAQTVAATGCIRIYGDYQNVDGIVPLRYDHMLPHLTPGLIQAALKLRRAIRLWSKPGCRHPLATFGGIDYTPWLMGVIKRVARYALWPAVIRIAQARNMLARLRPDILVINGVANIARAMIAETQYHQGRIAYMNHGIMLQASKMECFPRSNPNVVWVSEGLSHVEEFGRNNGEDDKPPFRPVIGSSKLLEILPVRGRRQDPPGRRILMLNYAAGLRHTVSRTKMFDRYMIDIMHTARRLIAGGFQVSYRPHGGNNLAYVQELLAAMGLEGQVTIDRSPDFPSALMAHDLLVANVSTTVYQSLVAGWPVVFYEPHLDPSLLAGLPACTDLPRPVARDPEELYRLILDGFVPDSLVERFPREFTTIHRERFIGVGPDEVSDRLAKLLIDMVDFDTALDRIVRDNSIIKAS